MFVEQVLTQRLGDVGKKLHTARSRNDQVALDLRLYLRAEIDEITGLVKELLEARGCRRPSANKTVILPGYTHLQRAQPITVCPSSDGLRHDASAGYGPACRLSEADERIANRLLRSGRNHLQHRPGVRGQAAGL